MKAVLSYPASLCIFLVLSHPVFSDVPSDPLVFEQAIWNDENNIIGLLEATENLPEESEEVLVAIYSSGINLQHEDLQGKIWINPGEIPENGIDDDRNGWIDDVNGLKIGQQFADDYWHKLKDEPYPTGNIDDWNGVGTYMAGVIAAVRNNDKGGAGMLEKVKILPISPPAPDPGSVVSTYKFPQPWSGNLYFDTAVDYSIQQGADILIVPQLDVRKPEVFDRAQAADLLIVVSVTSKEMEAYQDVLHYSNIITCPHPVYRESDFNETVVQHLDYLVTSPGYDASPNYGPDDAYFRPAYYMIDPDYYYLNMINVRESDQVALVAGSFAWLKSRFPEEDSEMLYTRLHQSGVAPIDYSDDTSEIRVINLSSIQEETPGKQYQRIEINSITSLLPDDERQPIDCKASSGLPVSIEVLSGPATVDVNGKVIISGQPGTVELWLTQEGDDHYQPAKPRLATFSVIDMPVYQVKYSTISEVAGNNRYNDSNWRSVAIWEDYMLATTLQATDFYGYCGVLFRRGKETWNVVNLIPFAELGFGSIANVSSIEIAANDEGFIIGAQVRMSAYGGPYHGKAVFVTINPNHSYNLSFLEGYGVVEMASKVEAAGNLIMVYAGRGGQDDIMKFFSCEDQGWSYVDEIHSTGSSAYAFGGDDLLLGRNQPQLATYHIAWDSEHTWSNQGEVLDKYGAPMYINDSKPEVTNGRTLVLGKPDGTWNDKASGYLDVYQKDNSGNYEYVTTLAPDDAFDGQRFGNEIALGEDIVVTSTPANILYGKPKPEVYIFQKNKGGMYVQTSRVQLPKEPSPDLREPDNSPGLYLLGNDLVIYHQTSLSIVALDELRKPVDSISWECPELVSSDEMFITLEATSASGAKVNYSIISGEAEIIGNQLIFKEGADEIIIEGSILETLGYEPAEPVYRALKVKPGSLWSESFESWCEEYNLDPSDRDPGADLDHDGNSILLEYALNGDPLDPESKSLFETIPTGDELLLRIPYRADGAMPKMFLDRLNPDDMQTWESVKEIHNVYYEGLDGFIEREVRLPLASEPELFRIRVVQ